MVVDFVAHAGLRLFLLIVLVVGGWIAWKYIQRQRFLRKLATLRITAEELRTMLDSGEKILVIDVRGELAGAEDLIPGALHIPMEELAQRHREIPRDRDIILFCS